MPMIGHLHSASPDALATLVAAFRDGLKEAGFVEGQNVAIEFRWAEHQVDRLPALVADLVRRQVAVIVCNTPAALAAKAATTTIPIVFGSGTDPVKLGLVASLARPGGNVTGVSFFSNDLEAKRLGLLHELVPQAAVVSALVNPKFPDAADRLRELEEAARALGKQLLVLNASTASEINAAFASFAQRRPDALIVMADPFTTARRYQIVALANRHAVPAIYAEREYALAGGLIDNPEQYMVLKPMVKELGCKFVSLGPLLVGCLWRMRIIKPRIGSSHTDGVVGTGPNLKSAIFVLNNPLRSTDVEEGTRQIRKGYWRVSFRPIWLEPDEMISCLG